MASLMWSKKLSVGNEILDSEHRNLIGLVGDVVRAIKARDGQALVQAFELLERWLFVHYANEEKIAQAVNFDFSGHKPAQQYSLQELRLMRDELVARNGAWHDDTVEHFTRSLKKWIIDGHIVNLDMRMKPALQAQGYKFWPGRCDDEAACAARADGAAALAASSAGSESSLPADGVESTLPVFAGLSLALARISNRWVAALKRLHNRWLNYHVLGSLAK